VREVRRGSRKALVDVELAELIRLLWMLGINTEACCQDSGESLADFARDNPHARSWVESLNGICLIDFADPSDLLGLFAALAVSTQKDFWDRIVDWRAPDAWSIWTHPIIPNISTGTPGVPRFGVFQLRFPRGDISRIAHSLKVAVEA
jgi:hypothetical protein